ncbi:MAG: hypothetical protein AAFZ67_11385 [Planctomycetota bacterium]
MHEQDPRPRDASLDAKWVAATTVSLTGAVFLLDSYIRRLVIAEDLNVPAEVLGSLIGDRGWAGYAAFDTLVVLTPVMVGWFLPTRPRWPRWLAVGGIGVAFLLAAVMLSQQTRMPPGSLVTSGLLLAAVSTTVSAKLALIGDRQHARFAALSVLGVGLTLLFAWALAMRGLHAAGQLEWFIKTRPPVQLRLSHHPEVVASLDGIDPATDEIRLLGSDGDFLYLYWRGWDQDRINGHDGFDPQRNPRTFAVPVGHVELLSDSRFSESE